MDITALENWLWEAACSIRGLLDAPKYKDYILPLLFYKRLCVKILRALRIARVAGLLLALFVTPARPVESRPLDAIDYPVCRDDTPSATLPWSSPLPFRTHLPLLLRGEVLQLPACTVYCGLLVEDDPYRPAGYDTYFADEFDCNRLLGYWVVQGQMTPASYTPPATGRVSVDDGRLRVAVPGADFAFPYLYLIDDHASSYDVPYATQRVDWIPEAGGFRVAMRVRFAAEQVGEHRISIYADGHAPGWGGPLFYAGTDNGNEEAWRGLIVGADRGNSFADLGDLGYPEPYTAWVVVTADFLGDSFTLSVDSTPVITRSLSSFKGYPQAATWPDALYIGSLAFLESPVAWTDVEVDWIRVYAPAFTPPAARGILEAIVEEPPQPGDPPTPYSSLLPAGPFANTPYWHEDFAGTAMPAYWQRVQNPDPAHSWTVVRDSYVALLNDDFARGVPVWAIFDDMLSGDILVAPAGAGESPLDYLRRRGGSPFFPGAGEVQPSSQYPRFDWRPDQGNMRFAWRGRQTANGYGVEISNAGHIPYFTGAIFYTLQDTTSDEGRGQFIYPGCQEQYFWRLHNLPGYRVPHEGWTLVTADYINGTVHLYIDGQEIGWWPESDCSLNWYLKGENATSPDVLFFGNLATGDSGPWSEVFVDWFATFSGL
jgi:hypothetical protein